MQTEPSAPEKGAPEITPKVIQTQGSSLKFVASVLIFISGLALLILTSIYLIEYELFVVSEALMYLALPGLFLLVFLPFLVGASVLLVPFNTILVVQRLGKRIIVKKPGIRILIPIIDEVYAQEDLRKQVVLIKANEAPTKKGTTVNVTATLFWWLLPENPARFIIDVQNPSDYIMRTAETAVREFIGQKDIEQLQAVGGIDGQALTSLLEQSAIEQWAGFLLKISDIEIPPDIRNALAEAEIAERTAKAEIIRAEAEIKVMEKLTEAVRKYLPDNSDKNLIFAKAMELRAMGTIRTAKGVLSLANISQMLGLRGADQL